jgi:hypothetical protein
MKTERHNRNRFLRSGALFIVKSSFGRLFWCSIRKLSGEGEENFISGESVVDEGVIVSRAETFEGLKSNLGDACKLKLEYGLHRQRSVRSKILKTDFFHN